MIQDCLLEITVDEEGMQNYIDGYVAGLGDHLDGDPNTRVYFDEEWFARHLMDYCEIKPAKGESA